MNHCVRTVQVAILEPVSEWTGLKCQAHLCSNAHGKCSCFFGQEIVRQRSEAGFPFCNKECHGGFHFHSNVVLNVRYLWSRETASLQDL